jgi:Fe-S-cluster containining protein
VSTSLADALAKNPKGPSMSMCDSCHAGCCRSYAVPISGADIIRITSDLGLSFWDFVCRWEDPDGEIAQKYAPHFHFEDEPEMPFVMCLIRGESQTWPGTGKCMFLEESPVTKEHPLGTARCGIYDSRPAACRAFPTKLSPSSELAIICDVPDRGRPSTDPVYELCPGPWEKEDFDAIHTVQDLIVAEYEMQFFNRIATVWNRRPGPFSAFPEFLNTVYSQRIRKESAKDVARNDRPDSDLKHAA